MKAVVVALALALLAGCSCCSSVGQVRTYVIDDATAMRSGPSGFPCVDVCNALGFGAADGDRPDAGPPPIVRASSCSLDHGTTAWTLRCYFGRGCPS